MSPRTFAFALALLAALVPAAAQADPCKAIPDKGKLPQRLAKGRSFSGPVVYVGDGDSLCVAATAGREGDRRTWVEVRLADFYAPELREPGGAQAKAELARLAEGRQVTCRTQNRTWDRVAARCLIDGEAVGDLLRRRKVREGGRGR